MRPEAHAASVGKGKGGADLVGGATRQGVHVDNDLRCSPQKMKTHGEILMKLKTTRVDFEWLRVARVHAEPVIAAAVKEGSKAKGAEERRGGTATQI